MTTASDATPATVSGARHNSSAGLAAGAGVRAAAARLWSGWTVVAVICLCILAIWLPDLDLPLGNSDDGRILGRFGLHARNFWELGPIDSRFGAAVEPFIRAEYDVAPRAEPPVEATFYAHHPPLQMLITIASVGALGDNLPALRIVAFVMGSATVAFMALLLRVRGISWGPTLLAITAMACTGFFYVYARIGVGYSLLVASTAAVAWLREAKNPSRPALIGVGVLAALTAMQSWIAMASLAPLALWLFTSPRHRHKPALDGAHNSMHGRSRSASDSDTHAGDPASTVTTSPWRMRPRARAHTHAGDPASTVTTPMPAAPDVRAGVAPDAAPRSTAIARAWIATRWSRPLTAVVTGAIAGGLITATWMISATDISELAERVAFRTGTDVSTVSQQANFTFGEFLERQWRFASHELMAPLWLRVLLLPALLAGLIDRRTRIPTAITLWVAATLTFAFMQGAWIHRLWNFPWLAPATIGMAALFDAARRALKGRAQRLRAPSAALGALAAAITLFFVVSGGTRDFYLSNPSHAGVVLAQASSQADLEPSPELVWVTLGISTPRWVTYYLDAPVWTLDEDLLQHLQADDLILTRTNRVPDFFPDDALDEPIAAHGKFRLILGEQVLP